MKQKRYISFSLIFFFLFSLISVGTEKEVNAMTTTSNTLHITTDIPTNMKLTYDYDLPDIGTDPIYTKAKTLVDGFVNPYDSTKYDFIVAVGKSNGATAYDQIGVYAIPENAMMKSVYYSATDHTFSQNAMVHLPVAGTTPAGKNIRYNGATLVDNVAKSLTLSGGYNYFYFDSKYLNDVQLFSMKADGKPTTTLPNIPPKTKEYYGNWADYFLNNQSDPYATVYGGLIMPNSTNPEFPLYSRIARDKIIDDEEQAMQYSIQDQSSHFLYASSFNREGKYITAGKWFTMRFKVRADYDIAGGLKDFGIASTPTTFGFNVEFYNAAGTLIGTENMQQLPSHSTGGYDVVYTKGTGDRYATDYTSGITKKSVQSAYNSQDKGVLYSIAPNSWETISYSLKAPTDAEIQFLQNSTEFKDRVSYEGNIASYKIKPPSSLTFVDAHSQTQSGSQMSNFNWSGVSATPVATLNMAYFEGYETTYPSNATTISDTAPSGGGETNPPFDETVKEDSNFTELEWRFNSPDSIKTNFVDYSAGLGFRYDVDIYGFASVDTSNLSAYRLAVVSDTNKVFYSDGTENEKVSSRWLMGKTGIKFQGYANLKDVKSLTFFLQKTTNGTDFENVYKYPTVIYVRESVGTHGTMKFNDIKDDLKTFKVSEIKSVKITGINLDTQPYYDLVMFEDGVEKARKSLKDDSKGFFNPDTQSFDISSTFPQGKDSKVLQFGLYYKENGGTTQLASDYRSFVVMNDSSTVDDSTNMTLKIEMATEIDTDKNHVMPFTIKFTYDHKRPLWWDEALSHKDLMLYADKITETNNGTTTTRIDSFNLGTLAPDLDIKSGERTIEDAMLMLTAFDKKLEQNGTVKWTLKDTKGNSVSTITTFKIVNGEGFKFSFDQLNPTVNGKTFDIKTFVKDNLLIVMILAGVLIVMKRR